MNVAEPHVEIGSLITRTPEIKGGCPRIAGTGIDADLDDESAEYDRLFEQSRQKGQD